MSTRLIEILFQRSVFLLVPITLLTAAGALWGYVSAEDSWRSSATIWVERPSDFNVLSGVESNPYISPAQNQANLMRELLSTKSFLTRISNRAGNADPATGDLLDLQQDTGIFPLGTHTLAISFTSEAPETAMRILDATIAEFREYYASNARQRVADASEFYKEQLKLVKSDYDLASVELRAYVATRPQFANINLASPPASALTDGEFSRLSQNLESNKERYERVLDRYADAQVVARTSESIKGAFNIIDEPELPLYPIPASKRDLLAMPMLGFVFGSALAVALFLVFWRLDDRVRVAEDLAFLTGVQVTALPALKARRRYHWPKSFVRIAVALQCGRSRLVKPAPGLGASTLTD